MIEGEFKDEEEILRAFCTAMEFDSEFWFRFELHFVTDYETDFVDRLPIDADVHYWVFDSERNLDEVHRKETYILDRAKRICSYVGARNEVVSIPTGYGFYDVSSDVLIIQLPETYNDQDVETLTKQLKRLGVEHLIVRNDIKFLTLESICNESATVEL